MAETLDTAPALLLVLADLTALAAVDRDLARYTLAGGASIYPFVWSLLLAARAEGLGGVITTMPIRREDDVRALFAIPDTVRWPPWSCWAARSSAPRRLTRAPVGVIHLGRPLRRRPFAGTVAASAAQRRAAPSDRAEMGHGTERSRRGPPALQLRPPDRLLPRRLLQHRRRGPRRAHGVHPGDRGVPGLLGVGRQRPVDAAPRIRVRRLAARRPVVPVRRRWQEAFEAGMAPPVVLASTHAATLEWVQLGDLVAHAI